MKNAFSIINKSQVITVIDKTLHYIDKRLVAHGERVAYIILEMLRHAGNELSIDRKSILIMSIFHDIGAYKTEEIDEMVSFDSGEIWNHSIYGYLFLKNMSPIGEEAQAILYHHLEYKNYRYVKSDYLDYAALINIADRLDILVAANKKELHLETLCDGSGTRFKPEYVELLLRSDPDKIAKKLRNGSYKQDYRKIVQNLDLPIQEAFEYLKMLAFSVDFRSEHTVTHTINTTAISMELGKRFALDKDELSRLYIGALLHDIGKVAISPDILEFQGRLSPEQMTVMKQHVVYTREIIEGLVDPDICRIASRHHEKLDGSGYPEGLHEADLTLSEQIIAVADIVSALTGRRSYKEPFPKEKTLAILRDMQQKHQLSYPVCETVLTCFDEIMDITDSSRNPVIELYTNLQTDYMQLSRRINSMVERNSAEEIL